MWTIVLEAGTEEEVVELKRKRKRGRWEMGSEGFEMGKSEIEMMG